MARYELRFKPTAAKDLGSLPKADVRRILARIDGLRDDPRPPGCEKLSAQERYCVRQGDYRIVYSVDDDIVVVVVVRVGHRREAHG